MTQAEIDAAQRREQARMDVEDITALEAYQPFQRYFMRRLRMKRTEATNKLIEDGGDNHRFTLRAFLEIEKMMVNDKATALRELV